MSLDPGRTTQLLNRLREGDSSAAEELLPAIHAQLHAIARGQMKSQRSDHTLQPTALVNEAWLRLCGAPSDEPWESRAQFVRVAAVAMRRILVDHARRRGALKRQRGEERVLLDEVVEEIESRAHDLVKLDAALEKLEQLDGELARIVELRFFAGLSVPEAGRVLELSAPTVQRRWRTARAWLRGEVLRDRTPPGD